MSCKNPERCKKMVEKWEARKKLNLDTGEAILENMRTRLEKNEKVVNLTEHINQRGTFRAFSETIDVNIVFKYGWVIEYYTTSSAEYMTILGYARGYRPLHLVLALNKNETRWKAITAYDPRTEEFRWTNDYQTKVCFCKMKK